MRLDKIQTETLKELMNPKGRVVYYETTDDTSVVVIPKGTAGYVIPKEKLFINLNNAQAAMAGLPGAVDPGDLYLAVKLEPTDEYRMGGSARKYLAEGRPDQPVYIDTKLLAAFDSPMLYQNSYSPLGMVTVAEYSIVDDDLWVVGYVCPTRVEEN